MNFIILDNGAYTAKVGYATDISPRCVPNCVIKAKSVRNRVFIGDQIDDCKDLSGLYYLLPFQKGYMVNGEVQKKVWDHIFSKDVLQVDFSESNIIITEPYFNFTSIQEAMNEIFFEEYQFHSVLRCCGGLLSQYKNNADAAAVNGKRMCCLVIDSGYSFTHIVPYSEGKQLEEGTRRINVGGKLLTNYLKDIISYRQLMVMDETYVMNQLKEDVCYVSTDFAADMCIAKKRGAENTVVQDYVLPDYTHIKRGHVKTAQDDADSSAQLIRMNNERFCVAEVLFHPSDIGLDEMGLPEAIIHSVSSLPEEIRPHLYSNIVLTGGNCLLPGFRERLMSELRAITPDEFDVNIHMPDNPTTYAWQGGCQLAADTSLYQETSVTKQDYDEHGHDICVDTYYM